MPRKTKRMCLGNKGLWLGFGKSGFSLGEKKRREKKMMSKIQSDPDAKPPYCPTTFVNLFPYTYELPVCPVSDRLTCRLSKPECARSVKGNRECVMFVKGQKLEEDVVSLLSNAGKRDYLVRSNGDKVSVADSVAGKHLLICCFLVPLRDDYDNAYHCRAMVAAYSHLVKNNENFEMAVVAEMVVEEEATFNRFFEAFPCLAIPFWDSDSRDFLCRCLGLARYTTHHAAVVVDPDQVVLQTDAMCFYRYGALGFPYCDDRLKALGEEDLEMRRRLSFVHNKGRLAAPVSLVELLGSDSLLSRCNGDDKVSVSDLCKKKCVALYLCVDGKFMMQVEGVRKKCEAQGLEFEIVLVHLPFKWDTASLVSLVQNNLGRYKLSSSWWVAPFHEEASYRLWHLLPPWKQDEVYFVADGGNAFELEGRNFIDELMHIPNSYPFTRMTMARGFCSQLKSSIILDSLLLHPCTSNVGAPVPVSELEGRKVMLYLDSRESVCKGESSLYQNMVSHYDGIKRDYPDSEVVFVPVGIASSDCPRDDGGARHPWLVLPVAAAEEASIGWKLLGDFPPGWPALVAFGEDGMIRSRKAHHSLEGGSLFADTMLQEMAENWKHFVEKFKHSS